MRRSDEKIVVQPPRQREVGDRVQLVFPVAGFEQPELCFEVDRAIAHFLSDRGDAALAALLIPAMKSGRDLVIRAPLSERLYRSAQIDLPHVLGLVDPTLLPIRVAAETTGPAPPNGAAAVLTGLSCGVDSFATCQDYLLDPKVPPSLRITHFLFNDVGSHGREGSNQSRRLFNARLERSRPVAALLHRPLIRVASNMGAFYTGSFQSTHTLRNSAVVLALQGGARYYLYSASFEWSALQAKASYDIAFTDPAILPLLSTETLECLSAGADLSRRDKIERIADLSLAQEWLDVCTRSLPNCSVCWKCARVLLTLELLGKAEAFTRVFDLAKYRAARAGILAYVVATRNQNPNNADILDLMRSAGYRWTLAERLRAGAAVLAFAANRRLPSGAMQRLYHRATAYCSAPATQRPV
ncbi:MAG: hypothetical protein EXQ96_00995 [Alphaproteobacteria bacterium]|nr:hypothetical protein [Alphaproteobacteria bacterium]